MNVTTFSFLIILPSKLDISLLEGEVGRGRREILTSVFDVNFTKIRELQVCSIYFI
jgi:hypothetical protein